MRAVDGNKNTDFHSLSCSHTHFNEKPWWRVDLQSYQMVKKVTLTNRGGCCPERLSNLEIRVGDVDGDPKRNGLWVYYFLISLLFGIFIRVAEIRWRGQIALRPQPIPRIMIIAF